MKYIQSTYQWICICLISLLIIYCHGSIYNYSVCDSSTILNTKTLSCVACGLKKRANPLQNIANECICKNGYYASDGGLCLQYFSGSSNLCPKNQYIKSFNNDGSTTTSTTTSTLSCANCDTKAYQNSNGTGCNPCGIAMTYNDTAFKCQCIDSTKTVETSLGCFSDSLTSNLGLIITSSTYSSQLKYLIPGCYYYKDPLSCSQMVNLCVYSQLLSGPQCDFFTKSNLTSLIYSDTINAFRLSDISKSTSIQMKIIYYLPEGNYLKEKSFQLADVMRCGLPSQADMSIGIGNNIQVSCGFNFNNLVAKMQSNTYKNYLYQLLILGQNNQYYQVEVFINDNIQGVKRFFLEDTFSDSSSITFMSSLNFVLNLNSEGQLVSPSLYLNYKKVGLSVGLGVTPTSQAKQTISYSFKFTSDISGFWSVVLPIFIVINVLVLIHSALKTYVGYLNRKTPFLFFLNFIDIWSLWMFYTLLVLTGYLFLFTKTTSSIYTFMSSNSTLYVTFYIVFGLMVLFRIVSVIIDKNDKLNIQTFMINWQKGQFRNSWRQIFITNSLAQFCTYRTFSVFWLMLVMLFFMSGINWEDHSAEVITTRLSSIQYFNPKNKIYLYFLSSSILLVIAIMFKILRRITVLFWPYPFEDFVDYCSVTNISFFFMKKRSPEAYYIHASIPDKTDVTYKQINHAIRRGQNKSRSIGNQVSPQNLKMYIMYVNRELQQKFNQMLKKQQDQDHNRHVKYSSGVSNAQKPSVSKHPFFFREQFIQKRLKPTLQQISQGQDHRNKTKSCFQSFFNLPTIDLRNQKGLNENQVIFDDKMDLVKQVFPNGDEFQELHTIIIVYLLWVVVTGSSPIAAFLTYFCDQYIFNAWIANTYRKNLQKMTRVKEGFML